MAVRSGLSRFKREPLSIAILGWADRYGTTSNGPADCSEMDIRMYFSMAYRWYSVHYTGRIVVQSDKK